MIDQTRNDPAASGQSETAGSGANRRDFLLASSAVIAAAGATLVSGAPSAALAQPTAEKPNIVFILLDNVGWGDLGVYGGMTPTPRIDKIANEGIRFNSYYVEAQCTPSRSAIMTGRMSIRSGTYKLTWTAPYGLSPWEYTLPKLLSEVGYATALYGKWHLGEVPGRLPADQGFDEWWGIKNHVG